MENQDFRDMEETIDNVGTGCLMFVLVAIGLLIYFIV